MIADVVTYIDDYMIAGVVTYIDDYMIADVVKYIDDYMIADVVTYIDDYMIADVVTYTDAYIDDYMIADVVTYTDAYIDDYMIADVVTYTDAYIDDYMIADVVTYTDAYIDDYMIADVVTYTDAYIDDYMIADFVTYTNAKIAKIRQEHLSAGTSNKYPYLKDLKDVIPEEIHALFGMMYTRAVLKQNLLSVTRLYQHQHSNPIYKAVVSQNRFEFLLRIVQLDNVEDRELRWDEDRFAAFRDFFNSFNQHCAQLRIPSELLSLDETLNPYRGRVTIKQYNPNKPAKYGVLYRSISDATLPYIYNTLACAGKPNTITPQSEYVTGTDNYTKYLIKGLERYVDIRGRNVSIDRFFTSMTIGF